MSTANFTMEELLAEAGWTERLARALARDGAEAGDLVQEVWARALRRAPSADRPARPWIRRVVANLFVSARRERSRRLAREKAVAAPVDVPTPEELVARMEAHRVLAETLAALEEPYRQAVILCYHGGLEPAEIARTLGLPGGTVRRRLKEGRDRLRRRLEERHGDPRIWLAALGPQPSTAAGERARSESLPSGVAMGQGRGLLGLGAVSLGVLLLAAGLLSWRVLDGGRGSGRGGEAGEAGGGRGTPIPRPSGPRFARFAGVAPVDCPELEILQKEIADLKAAVAPLRDLRAQFNEGAPNPAAEAVLRPIIDGIHEGGAEGCGHSLSCRGNVCDLVTLHPDGTLARACRPSNRSLLGVLEGRLGAHPNNATSIAELGWDAAAQRKIRRSSTLVRLEQGDAAVVPAEKRRLLGFSYDLTRPFPHPPEGQSEACRLRWQLVAAQLRGLRGDTLARFPGLAFAQDAPAPDLERRFEAWARKVLPQPEGSLPFFTSCAGTTCVLTPRTKESAEAAEKRACTSTPRGQACTIDPTTWVGRLMRHEIARAVGILSPPLRQPDGTVLPIHFRLNSETQRRHAGALTWFVGLVHGFDWKAEIRACERRDPQRGTLLVRFTLPSSEPAAPGERPQASLTLTGNLGHTPLAACVRTAFERALAAADPPPVVAGRHYDAELDFPFDPSLLERRWSGWKAIEDQRAQVPPL